MFPRFRIFQRVKFSIDRCILLRHYSAEVLSAKGLLQRVKKVRLVNDSDTAQVVEKVTSASLKSTPIASTPIKTLDKSKILDQYQSLEKFYPQHILLMQVGDFYEAFGDQAHIVSQVLEIGICGNRFGAPMTGFPVRNVDNYIEKLIKAGSKIALADQIIEDGILQRRITRIITPGTVIEDNLLDSRKYNFVLAIHEEGLKVGLAWIDISTGFFRVHSVIKEFLFDELSRIAPAEIIFGNTNSILERYKNLETSTLLTPFSAIQNDIFNNVFLQEPSTGEFFTEEFEAAKRLLTYVKSTMLNEQPYIEYPQKYINENIVHLDGSAMKSLEILKNNSTNTKENSLLGVLDETSTGAGSRLLAQRLQNPLQDTSKINKRLDQISIILENNHLIKIFKENLSECLDIERSYQRLALNRSAGGPKDMKSIMITLKHAICLIELANTVNLDICDIDLEKCSNMVLELEAALEDNLPQRASDGGFIKSGYNLALDEKRSKYSNLETECEMLLETYRRQTGKANMRLTDKKTLGWLIEVNQSEDDLDSSVFIYDSTANGKKRYRTNEMEQLNSVYEGSAYEILLNEIKLYEELRDKISEIGSEIMKVAKVIAELDVTATLAQIANERGYIRPIITNDPADFIIINGQHPVVHMKHEADGRVFTRNSCDLSRERRFAFITGPNMGGKSTYLRQNALITLMAQCGMYVPAEKAVIGVVDAIFTRIGATDDLSRDRSTFMVEMSETASILNRATAQSLVIMDEVGRGTSAHEGYQLAHAICQYLYENINCRTLFATHYYELKDLIKTFPSSQMLMTRAERDEEGIVFLHLISSGVATTSNAIDIARLAGVPEKVLSMAQQV